MSGQGRAKRDKIIRELAKKSPHLWTEKDFRRLQRTYDEANREDIEALAKQKPPPATRNGGKGGGPRKAAPKSVLDLTVGEFTAIVHQIFPFGPTKTAEA